MEQRTREHVNLAQENSKLQAKLRASQVQLSEAEARAARFQMRAKTEEQRAQLLETRGGPEPTRNNGNGGDHAAFVDPSAARQLREREDDLAAAGAELSSLRQQLMEVLGANNALQVV